MSLKIIIYESYAFNAYGAVRYLLSIFKYINKSKFDPILVTPLKADFHEDINRAGCRTMILPPPDRLKPHGGTIMKSSLVYKFLIVLAIFRYSYSFYKLINEERPHLVHCTSIRSLLMIALTVKLKRLPFLWYVNGDLENKLLDKIGFIMADMILFQCETTKRRKYPHLVRKYESKIRILCEGIDLDLSVEVLKKDLTILRHELGLIDGNINIIFVGQLSPLKGVDYLIEALAEVRDKFPSVMLYLVGDHCINEYADYKVKLDHLIDLKGLKPNILFTGYRADALDILSLMDVFVLPSLSEGMPKSIIEAMSLGKPVIATKVGGVQELVRHGETGFIVEPRDSKSLAQAMIDLVEDKGLRNKFGERAKVIAFKNYSIRDSVSGLENLYYELFERSIKR